MSTTHSFAYRLEPRAIPGIRDQSMLRLIVGMGEEAIVIFSECF